MQYSPATHRLPRLLRSLPPAWLLCLGGLLGLQLVAPRSLRADDIPSITLSDAGPNRPLPLGQSFYLTGTPAAGAKAVYPVFVRYSYAPWGIRKGVGIKGCTQVREALSNLNSDPKAVFSKTGAIAIDDLWGKPNTPEAAEDFDWLLKYHQAYLPGVWTRPASESGKDPVTYKVLIPGDRFFRTDASYCLLIYQEGTSLKAANAVTEAVSDFITSLQKCTAPSSTIKSAPTPCVDAAYQTYEDAIRKILSAAGKTDSSAILPKIHDLISHAGGPFDVAIIDKFNYMTQYWSEFVQAADSGKYLALGNPSQGDPLAAVLIGLLANEGKQVIAVVETDKNKDTDKNKEKSGIAFYSADGKVRISHIWLSSDFSSIVVANSNSPIKPEDRRELKIDLSKLLLPDSEVSALELLEWTHGRVLLSGSYTRFLDFGDLFLNEIRELSRQGALLDNSRLGPLIEIRNRLQALSELVLMALRVDHDTPETARSIDARPQTILAQTGRWLRQQLRACNPTQQYFACRPTNPATPYPPVHDLVWFWPHYANITDNPLNWMAAKLTEYINASDKWYATVIDLQQLLAVTVVNIAARQPEIVVQGGQQSWLFNYITLTTGFNCILDATQPFWLHQAGLQIYFWPNLFEEPMWTNGIYDFRRLVFLEVGVGSSIGPFGPEGRFSGPPGINALSPVPPFFLGAGLQLLPYTSLSAGVAFIGRRSSTLTQEETVFRASPYIGLSVQVNIPDAIKFLSKSKSFEQTGRQ